jgi:hypothetical protein
LRSKRARGERQEALPSDLKADAKTLIRALAQVRSKKEHEASDEYAKVEYAARQKRNRRVAEAVLEFRRARAAILEAAQAQADERRVA